MNVEPGNMPPGHKHLDEGIVYQPLFLQHLEYMSTEKFTQWTQIRLHHYKEIIALQKQAVGHQCVKVRMPPDIVSKRLNSNDNSRGAEFLSKRYPEKLAQAFGCTLTEFAQ